MTINFFVQKYPQEGDLQHSYYPFKNLLNKDNSIVDFRTSELSINLNNPLNIECQPSYDGTVNLIINDDINPPRIINSRFSKIEDNKFRVITREQSEQTNLYKYDEVDRSTRLFRNISIIPKLYFVELNYYGQLKGGNYTFYLKYADDDYNKTDIVCESGQVSIFHGNLSDIKTISGTLADERTSKSIKLKLENIDTTFSKIYVYYTREYSDLNGARQVEAIYLPTPYEINHDNMEIVINGFEPEEKITLEELNVSYNYVTEAKTQAQVQNMLFFGNVETQKIDIKNLQNISYFFNVSMEQKKESIGWINPKDYSAYDETQYSLEYYSPENIYYYLGYWPEELYRLGVVYIMNDDSLSPVFDLLGCEFDGLGKQNHTGEIPYKTYNSETKQWEINYLERGTFIEGRLTNTFGTFRTPSLSKSNSIINNVEHTVKPWYFKITIPTFKYGDKTTDLVKELKELGVKGLFFVRQKRIPITLCQGVAAQIDRESSLPVLSDKDGWFTESFLTQGSYEEGGGGTGGFVGSMKGLNYDPKVFTPRRVSTESLLGSVIYSTEAMCSPDLQSALSGENFLVQKMSSIGTLHIQDRNFAITDNLLHSGQYKDLKCAFINENVPYKYIDGYGFSSRAGTAESVRTFSFFGSSIDKYASTNYALVRGIYSPYIGVCGSLNSNCLYSIKISNYSTQYMYDYFKIRRDDVSEFYAISDRYNLYERKEDEELSYEVYRGDCFTSTTTIRINRNFNDPDVPLNETIIDPSTWRDHYGGYYNTPEEAEEGAEGDKLNRVWTKINRADLNAVPLGMWLTYKCMANSNIGLRAIDRSNTEEAALFGNNRLFYPLHDSSVKAAYNIPESCILNNGYSATVGRKYNIAAPKVPYIRDIFDTRIMFSNMQVDGDFKNGYRIFQGLSYKDIDRQYGAIVKLLPWGTNLLCVFEHGIGIIPVNEKALIQTSTDQPIHMYGAGVLQNQISLISPDYGSIWPESIIRTPIGVYGVDTYAKKIWRYSDSKGLETLSDMKIQRFLNDNMALKEKDKYPIIGLKNVKTHYNNYKGDVMFTFYNYLQGKEWNMCFNERQGKWITRYSWTPLYSANINNVFYSLDKKRTEVLAHIFDNRNTTYGIRTTQNQWDMTTFGDLESSFETELSVVGVELLSKFDLEIESIETSYINNNREEIKCSIPSYYVNYNPITNKLSWTRSAMEQAFSNILSTNGDTISYKVPLYYKINVRITPYIKGAKSVFPLYRTIGVVVDYTYCEDSSYDDLLVNGFYVHGRAGIFNEISYSDDNATNQILPTKWYDKQEPFEFEFVVNNEVGTHKVFNNLVIISNNVQPKSFEFEITGDVYSLFKTNGTFNKQIKADLYKTKKGFRNAKLDYDPILNNYSLIISQEAKNMEDSKYRRRLGNIHYKEDSWYCTIDPLIYDPSLKALEGDGANWQSTKIRDKYLKVRVKYTGEDLVIITALKTLMTVSYS